MEEPDSVLAKNREQGQVTRPVESPVSDPSLGAPLAIPLFRALWIAATASNVGTWMHDVAAAWLMTGLDPSPLMVSLVQTASSAPFFLLALPSGAIADIVDRRRLLMATQTFMSITALVLSGVCYMNLITPPILLLFTFLLGIGNVLNAPAWQSIIPEVVPRRQLMSAITLGSVSFNMARAVGPALGGLIVAAEGPWAAFLLNALSFSGMVFVLATWKRPVVEGSIPPEHFGQAMVIGLRHVRHSRLFQTILFRSFIFIFPASAVWALLPVLAKSELRLGPAGYGVLLFCMGSGAIAGAFLLPKLRKAGWRMDHTQLATLLLIPCLVLLAWWRQVFGLYGVMSVIGICWVSKLSTINVAAQQSVPNWVRARALSVYSLVFFGGLAAGAFTWGYVARETSLSVSFLCASGLLLLEFGIGYLLPLPNTENVNFSASKHWPTPAVAVDLDDEDHPVMVLIEYRVESQNQVEFLQGMEQMRAIRLRHGSYQWRLCRDLVDSERFIETFMDDSWIGHMRHHERVSESDKVIQDRVNGLHRGPEPPVVHHMIVEKW